jgi:hypothetical protein
MHGLSIPRLVVRRAKAREKWLSKTGNHTLAAQLNMLWLGYDSTSQQVRMARSHLSRLSGKYKLIKFWSELPGIGLVRATTLFAYLDTPWRFKKKNKLWKYGVLRSPRRGLRRWSPENRQRHRQQRQAKTGEIAITLGRQQDAEKRNIGRCNQRDKAKE